MTPKAAIGYKQDRRSIAIQTPLGEDVLLLRSFRGDEGLSRLFRFDLELLSTSSTVEAKEVVGKNATVGVRMRDGKDRYFNGIISRLSLAGGEGGFTVYRAELVPWTWLLTRTTDCRVFQNLAVPAIVEKVFTDLGFLDVRNRLTKTYPSREYCVQYRETDFNFVSRLLEQCGIYYFFEHENGKHTLVLADTSAENRPVHGLEEARYRASKGDNPEPDAISSWTMSVALRPAKYSLAAYNFETPNANLLVQVESPQAPIGAAKYEVYDYPGGYAKRPEGEDVVRLRIEEQETQIVTISGASTCRGLAAGARIDLVDYPHDDLNLPYLVTSVTHAVSETSYIPSAEDDQKQYENTFTAIPLTVPFRPVRVTPRPIIHGVQTAVVVGKKGEELWVDKHGRVKVQFFWDREGKRDENSSCWVRVSQNWAGKRWGAMFLPRIGQEVLVEFLEGDPDAPIITGRVYNGDQTPPYDLPDEQSKSTLKSSSSKGGAGFNEWRFDDKAGAEQVFIHGQRDLDFVIERQSRELIGQEQHVIVTGSRVEQVGQEQHLKVGGDLVEEIAGARFLSAEKGLFIRGGGRIVIESGEITLKAGGGFITVGGGGVTIQGTIVNINSGGAAGAGASKAARLPVRATSAGAGATGEPGTGIPGEPGVPAPDPVLLYREALEKNSAKFSAADRRDYEAALKELEDAKLRKDLPAMKAAQAKLDAILTRNGIPVPPGADAAIAGVVAPTAPGSGTSGRPAEALSLPTLSVQGRHWRNGGALYVPRWVSALAILSHLIHSREGEAVAFLNWAVATGFNGIRVFAGALTWANQSAADARRVLPRLLDLAAERGLAVEVTAITGSKDGTFAPKAHLAEICGIIRGRAYVVLEIANEVGHPTQSSEVNDPRTLQRWGNELAGDLIWAVGAAPVDEPDPAGAYPTSGGKFCTAHLDRGRPFWANIRRVREIFAISETQRVPSLDNERMGADELDGSQTGRQRINDPVWFFTAGVLDRGFAGVGGVHHSQAGLNAVLPGSVQQACADAEIAGHRLVAGILGDATPAYLNTGHAGSPVGPISKDAWDRSLGRMDGRCYSFVAGNRGVTVVLGLPGDAALDIPWQGGWRPVGAPTVRVAKDGSRVQVFEIAQ
jgi:type VI secretion system secreted protein VgrG